MSSEVLKVKCRRDIGPFLLESSESISEDSNKKDISVWLFEWYLLKGRRLPSENEGKSKELHLGELNLFYDILLNLPNDFPMIRHPQIWSKWLFPNAIQGFSKEQSEVWINILNLIERKFPDTFVNEFDLFVELVCVNLLSKDLMKEKILISMLSLLTKMLTIYVQPKKGFNMVVDYLLDPLWSFYKSQIEELEKINVEIDLETLKLKLKLLDEIINVIRSIFSNSHMPSIESALNDIFKRFNEGSIENISNINYTRTLINRLIGKNSDYNGLFPVIIDQIHKLNDQKCVFYTNRDIINSDDSIKPDYLLFFLFLNINLGENEKFISNIEHINNCFYLLIKANTFDINECVKIYNSSMNFKENMFERILGELQVSIFKKKLSPHIYKCYELCILISPIKALKLLPGILSHFKLINDYLRDKIDNEKELEEYLSFRDNNKITGLERTILTLISSHIEVNNLDYGVKNIPETADDQLLSDWNKVILENKHKLKKQENIIKSLSKCFSVLMLTFLKLNDFSLFFTNLNKELSAFSPDFNICEEVLLSQDILNEIKDTYNLVLPGRNINFFDSFFDLFKEAQNTTLLNEYISASWFGIIMISIPVFESSANKFRSRIEEIHEYIIKRDLNSKFNSDVQNNFVHVTLSCGIINLIRKVSSWNMKEKEDLKEIVDYYHSKISNFKLVYNNGENRFKNYSNRPFFVELVNFISYLTKLRDSGVQSKKEILLLFHYYEELMSILQTLESNSSIERIITRFLLLNISGLQGIEDYFKSMYYNQDSNFDGKGSLKLYLNSILKIYLYKVTNIEAGHGEYYISIKIIVKIPYLILLLFKEMRSKLSFGFGNNSYGFNIDDLKRRRKEIYDNVYIENICGNIKLFGDNDENKFKLLCNFLDFFNSKEIIMYLLNNKDLYSGDISDKKYNESLYEKSYFTFEVIYKFYCDLLFIFEYEDNIDLCLIEKTTFGILNWIRIEEEVNSNDLVRMLTSLIFEINIKCSDEVIKNRYLNRYLSLIIKLKSEKNKSFDNLVTIFNKTLFFSATNCNENLKLKALIDYIFDEMSNLDWFWWLRLSSDQMEDIRQLKSIESVNNTNMNSWIIQIQFLIEFFKNFNEKIVYIKLDSSNFGKKIIDSNNTIKSISNGISIIKKLKADDGRNNTNLIYYIVKVSELYITLKNDILDCDEELCWDKFFEKMKDGNNGGNNKELVRMERMLTVTKDILDITEQIFNSGKPDCITASSVEGDLLLDFLFKLFTDVVLKEFNDLMVKCKNHKHALDILYDELIEKYLKIFDFAYRIIKMNIKHALFNENNIKFSEWTRYITKCIIEGCKIESDHFKDTITICRHMKLYEGISKLINNSPVIGFITEVFKKINIYLNDVNVEVDSNLMWLITSSVDFVWCIIKNKGYVYKSLLPSFRTSRTSSIEKWKISDTLYFNLEILLSKLVRIIEILLTENDLILMKSRAKANYIISTFSVLKISDIVSILYSCCVSCYISDLKNNNADNKVSLVNNKIMSLSNLVLTLSIKFSLFGTKVLSNPSNFLYNGIDNKYKEIYCLAIFESLTISSYIPIYTLLNPLWDQSRKKNNSKDKGYIDVWTSQFHLINESLNNLIYLGDCLISFEDRSILSCGLNSYIKHFKRMGRIYPLVVSQITRNKVQRYSISIISDLINYVYVLYKRIGIHDENSSKYPLGLILSDLPSIDMKNTLESTVRMIKKSFLYQLIDIIDDHCKKSLFVMLKGEQRMIFKQIIKNKE
ncbi:hypothetical protein FG386_001486 [Cryptosporidium ryanae]|uniref:uncharacterized protein n=1 Tax=Cryptosporidium ryanae TaxID=515981 RepID=UPI003519DC43|nr:hypothetical protein FG386_001486 [Cryptosporidium ryanae]